MLRAPNSTRVKAMTDVDPLPRLAETLATISAQLHTISDELRTLEATQVPPQPRFEWRPPMIAHPPSGRPTPPPYPPYPAPQYPPPATGPVPAEPYEPPPTLWERMSRDGAGSRLVAWLGGAVTLVGVLLLLALAVQRGYIGPAPRVLLGAVLAAVLLGIALRVQRIPGSATGAQALAATGLAVGYLDTIAASAYYHFVPAPAGLVIALMIAGIGVAIALRWDSQLLATFVTLACAASAVALSRDATLLVGFLLVLQIASGPATLWRRWTVLAVAAALPPVAAVLFDTLATSLGSHHSAIAVAALCLATTLAQTMLATALAHTDRDRTDVALGLLIAAPVPTLIAALLLTRYQAVGMTGGLGALLIGLSLLVRRLRLPTDFADGTAAVGLAGLFEATCIGFTGDARGIVLLLAAVLLAGGSAQLRYVPALAAAAAFGAAGLVFALLGGLPLGYVVRAPQHAVATTTIVTAAATGALLVTAALMISRAAGLVVTASEQDGLPARWALAAVVALYGGTGTVLSLGLVLSPDQHGFLVGHMLVTLSWTLGALVLLLRHVDSVPLRVAGLALVGAAAAKLLLFDLASLSGIPRVLAFLGGGLVLLAAGARYAKLVTTRHT